ncbi:head-tail connector protein [Staphylococcus epidermidis]|uniref:head-tail connector protein n=1 Tax=Staphylococcus epidermidis TaxID=1282 RepID=UPI0029034AE4|nr:head-tail connector protein [Staphylococcus epidermidis]MDU0427285.1 head-tail connector protein [Staphylococcus epidermidis]
MIKVVTENLAVSLEEMKKYLLIDFDDQDNEIKELIYAAQSELATSGVPFPEIVNPLYNLAVKMLVSNFYEDRNSIGTRGYKVDAIITKLAMNQHQDFINNKVIISNNKQNKEVT